MFSFKLTTLILLLSLMSGLLLSGCAEEKTDEVLIQEQIDVLQKAIETHDRNRFMDVIDEQYQDQLNNNQKTLQRMLMGFFLRYKDISVYASSNPVLLNALKNHQWQEVFVQARDQWGLNIDAFIFGHGMYEKAFNPFIGFTGKAYCIDIDESFYQQDKMTQYQILDQLLCDDIKKKNTLSDSSHLSPLPILGIPGWSIENESPDFYSNTNYFRAKRQAAK